MQCSRCGCHLTLSEIIYNIKEVKLFGKTCLLRFCDTCICIAEKGKESEVKKDAVHTK